MTLTAELADFIGAEVNEDQAGAVVRLITALARSYTRGGGFDVAGDPAPDIAAVIVTASARLLRDPSQMIDTEVAGPFRVSYRSGFDGWSVAELAALNRYRKRAQ
ncbi:hypothetical protein [Mycolicibacterium neoaurum]|uniref:hypothetical protein n=1 Tax=Mycolicibacterium neoaurum TaxID=1795 RepID=UPI0027E0E5BA|nr:hypothetical protein [Mycolicibacterium neoaurum]